MNKNDYVNDEDVKSFIKWIGPKLSTPNLFPFPHKYKNKKTKIDWSCDCIYSAYENYFFSGNFQAAQKTLVPLSQKLNEGINDEDQRRV